MAAFEPSKSKNKGKGRGLAKPSEPDMLPIMNLMVVLIPVLLSASEMVKIRILQVNLPLGGGDGPSMSSNQNKPKEPEEEKAKLELSITITKKGFFIGRKTGFLSDFFPEMRAEGGGVQKDENGKEIRNPEVMYKYEPNWEKNSKETGLRSGFPKEAYEKVTASLLKLRELMDKQGVDFPDSDNITVAAERDIDFQTITSTMDAVRQYTDKKGNSQHLFPNIELGGY